MEVALILYWISFVLVIVGALNWALVGVSPSYNLVEMVARQHSRWVYYLVGLAALYLVVVKVIKMTNRQTKRKEMMDHME
jgi:uncharacterized membrane protein YuzA (DUF378 family)